MLRLESPVQHFGRLLTRDVELDGIHVPAGAHIMVSYGSANRDERQWPEPERFDITRDNTRQIAWGHGLHGGSISLLITGDEEGPAKIGRAHV